MIWDDYTDKLKRAERKRIKREQRIQNRICVCCGKPLEDSEVYQACSKCRTKRSERAREKIRSYKEQELCLTCHEPLSEEEKDKHFVHCAKCRKFIRKKKQARDTVESIK